MLRNLNLKNRLVGTMGVMTLLMLLLGATSWVSLERSARHARPL